MLYAERDPDGKIIALSRIKTPGAEEITSAMDEELVEFLDRNGDGVDPRSLLGATDSGLIRVIEDLINILIDKKVIRFTDLPVEVQKKINARQKIRQRLSDETLMVDDIL